MSALADIGNSHFVQYVLANCSLPRDSFQDVAARIRFCILLYSITKTSVVAHITENVEDIKMNFDNVDTAIADRAEIVPKYEDV